jgi:pimeloyl-ACP methyl ester carboxylesterase
VDSTDADHFAAAITATLAPLLASPAAPDSILAPAMEAALNTTLAPMSTRGRMALGLTGPSYPQARTALIEFLLSPGFRSFVAYDPSADLAALSAPALMLFGGKDFQVPADQNAPPARATLDGRPGSEVVVVDDANHLFQTATTGALTEYGQIEETIAPATLERIVGWVRAASAR